jgi:arsenite-transporting ATPase
MVLKLVRPFTKRFKGLRPLIPEDKVYDSFGELIRHIGRLGDLLKDPGRASVRLVLNPDRVAVAETRRAFTYFNLFGFPLDAILVNKVFPRELADGYFHQWWKIQSEELDVIDRSFLNTTVFRIPYLDYEPLGIGPLEEMGRSIYGERLPDGVLSTPDTVKIDKADGRSRLTFLLPGLEKSSLDIGRRGGDLLIHTGDHARVFTLPDSLALAEVESAEYDEAGRLTILFKQKEEA